MSIRQDLENLWRARLKEAELRLRLARTYVREIQADQSLACLRSPDGTFAYQRALRLEVLAVAHYRRVLQIFSDLVVHNQIPDENEWTDSTGPPE